MRNNCILGSHCFAIVMSAAGRSTFVWLRVHDARRSITVASHARTRPGRLFTRMNVCAFLQVSRLVQHFTHSLCRFLSTSFSCLTLLIQQKKLGLSS